MDIFSITQCSNSPGMMMIRIPPSLIDPLRSRGFFYARDQSRRHARAQTSSSAAPPLEALTTCSRRANPHFKTLFIPRTPSSLSETFLRGKKCSGYLPGKREVSAEGNSCEGGRGVVGQRPPGAGPGGGVASTCAKSHFRARPY